MAKPKGLRNIPTIMKGGLRGRPRRPQDAFSELVLLRHERERLVKEHQAWQERIKLISSRLQEIAKMEAYLSSFMDPREPIQPNSPGKKRGKPADGLSPDFKQVTFHY